ncbi:MAG: hypothetical protein AAF583_14125 [Pseudomonadota bacterium]
MAKNRRARASRTNLKSRSPLAGKLFDADGAPLTPSHANKNGRRYRYYVSKHLIDGSTSKQKGWRIPAAEIERAVVQAIQANRETQLALIAQDQTGLTDERLLARVERIQIAHSHLAISVAYDGCPPSAEIKVLYQQRRRGVETRLVLQTDASRELDPVLVQRILRAMDWVDQLRQGKSISEIAEQQGSRPNTSPIICSLDYSVRAFSMQS